MSLALVGLLLAIGAVSCGESDFEAVVLNSNLFGGSRSDAAEGSPYWWMSKGNLKAFFFLFLFILPHKQRKKNHKRCLIEIVWLMNFKMLFKKKKSKTKQKISIYPLLGSPFKRAVAAGPPSQQFDFGANPYFRGGNAAKLYSAPGYLPPDQPTRQPPPPPPPTRASTVPCIGNGRACVPKFQCSQGFIDASQFRGSSSQVRDPFNFLVLFFFF